jgi:hypothetical protein
MTESVKILCAFGFFSDILHDYFNNLATVSDWENLYAVLTNQFNAQNQEAGWTWETEDPMALPMNASDLVWKTKVRFHAGHYVRNGAVESQKRIASFSCGLMGIRPVKSLSECNVSDERVLIPAEKNPSRRTFSSANADDCNLFRNQSRNVTVHLLFDNYRSPGSKLVRGDATFYQAFSNTKAIAASKAQRRSWKDFVLKLITSSSLQLKLYPADFSAQFFETRGEHKRFITEPIDSGNGGYLQDWAEECLEAILKGFYEEKDVPAFSQVLPAEVVKDFTTFQKHMADKAGKTSKWSFPKTIPTPQIIHTLAYLLFLTAPAAAIMTPEGAIENEGLDTLTEIISHDGLGTYAPSRPTFQILDAQYEQTVSFPVFQNGSAKPAISGFSKRIGKTRNFSDMVHILRFTR